MTLQVYRDKAQRRRWILVSSSDALDRDKEIIPVEALKADAERATQTGEYGPLLWWHVKGLELGQCDFNEMAGNKLVESGTFKSEAFADFVEKNADRLAVSIGFVHSPNDPGPDGVFKSIRRTERSLLPAGRASNPDARVLAVKAKGTNVTVRDVKSTHKWGPFVEMMFGGDEKAADDYLAQFGAEAGKSAGPDSEKAFDQSASYVVIRYAPKPWDRGKEPLTRNVNVPAGLSERQAEQWLREKLMMKSGETVVSFHPASGGKESGPDSEKGAQHPGDLTPAKVRELEQAASRVLDALTAVGGDMETLGRASVSFGGRYLSAYQQAQTAIRSAYQACIAMNSEAHEQTQIYRVAGKEAPEGMTDDEKAAYAALVVKPDIADSSKWNQVQANIERYGSELSRGLMNAANTAETLGAVLGRANLFGGREAEDFASPLRDMWGQVEKFRNSAREILRQRVNGNEAGKSRDGGEQWDNDGWGDGVDPANVMKQPPAGKFGDHDPISALLGGKE